MEPVRLNKYLSDHGICSRRQADQLILEGKVLVNGKKAEMGLKVTDADEITVDHISVEKKTEKKVIIAVNKPVGVVCTTKSFKGETNIVELVDYETRLYPVGRLDKDSEGLIFLTNDGHFAEEVTKASNYHEKEYEVVVNREYTDQFLSRLSKGIYLKELDKKTAPCKIVRAGNQKFRITLTQGMNRQIRRMCEAVGYHVISLKRIRIMNVSLGNLEKGAWRMIEGEELQTLKAEMSRKKGKKSNGTVRKNEGTRRSSK